MDSSRFFYVLLTGCLLWLNLPVMAQKKVGDRLVIAINNLPYSQRQVEVYMLIKEGIRPNGKKDFVIQRSNWPLGLSAFGEDMLVQQEALRLGSFQPSEKMIETYTTTFLEKVAASTKLEAATQRLGIDEQSIVRTLTSVLRVEAFRASKDRQADITRKLSGEKDKVRKQRKSKWLRALEERSVIRLYRGAETYVDIHPTAGG